MRLDDFMIVENVMTHSNICVLIRLQKRLLVLDAPRPRDRHQDGNTLPVEMVIGRLEEHRRSRGEHFLQE